MSNLSKAFALMFLGGGTLGGGIALANYNPPIARQAALDDCKTSGARNPSNVTENPYLKSLEKGVANGVIPEPSNNATFTVTNANGEKVKLLGLNVKNVQNWLTNPTNMTHPTMLQVLQLVL